MFDSFIVGLVGASLSFAFEVEVADVLEVISEDDTILVAFDPGSFWFVLDDSGLANIL